MESLGELIFGLIGTIAFSIMSIGIIWVIGLAIVNIINAVAGTYFMWNIAYSILIYGILVILLVVFTKK